MTVFKLSTQKQHKGKIKVATKKHTVHIKLTAEEMKLCDKALNLAPELVENKSDLFRWLLASFVKKGTD